MKCDIALVYLVQTFKNEGRHYKSTIETDQQFIQHRYHLDYGMHNLLDLLNSIELLKPNRHLIVFYAEKLNEAE